MSQPMPPLCPRCCERPCKCKVPGEKSAEEKAYWAATARDASGISKRIGEASARRQRLGRNDR